MDEVDVASEYQDNAVKSGVERSRRQQESIESAAKDSFGRCLNCLDHLDHSGGKSHEEAKFCDTDCRDDYVKLSRSRALRPQ